jgi:hypothetical protein
MSSVETAAGMLISIPDLGNKVNNTTEGKKLHSEIRMMASSRSY